ncbi:STM3941 family protein [Methylobacterium sp. NEAU 140]|uniref:STM3941 family protein n=1 Tax=Methylobacterium sp. NEAU 140 TaxID=3064945 RepID=UPI002733CE6D|nr:STM3941 family protein [Methylobacterium sp. NEAU 140]MDP4027127.1 STM3941 family protein [Methylobacterium sp. NEAU 140]
MDVVEIYRSPWRTIGLFLASVGFTAFAGWLIYAHPTIGLTAVTPGSFGEFEAYVGVAFFGLCIVLIFPKLFQSKLVVSVGPRGIYDRRLSTDWIPWKSIRSVTPVQFQRQRMLVLEIDPAADADLPWTKGARRKAKLNRVFGRSGYWMTAADLRGGFPALVEAVSAAKRGA